MLVPFSGLWKCCTVLFTVPDECVLGVVGVFGVDEVCVLWVLVLGMVEPGEDPAGDRLSSHSRVSLDRFSGEGGGEMERGDKDLCGEKSKNR